MKKSIYTLVFACTFILMSGCTALIENGLEQNFIGCWNSTSYYDSVLEEEIELPNYTFNTILGRQGDSFDAEADGTFRIYDQQIPNSTTTSGTFTYEFSVATFAFDNGDTIVRIPTSLDAEFLSLPDTVNGTPIIINFAEVCE